MNGKMRKERWETENQNARIFNNYGCLLLAFHNSAKAHHRTKESLPWFRRALCSDPNFGIAMTNYALALHSCGKLWRAERWYKRALCLS